MNNNSDNSNRPNIVEERTFFTNDRRFERKIPQTKIISSPCIVVDRNEIIGGGGAGGGGSGSGGGGGTGYSNQNKSIEEMSADEMRRYLKEKNDSSLSKKLSNALTSTTTYVNSVVFRTNANLNNTTGQNKMVGCDMVTLEQSHELSLQDLGCLSIDEAFRTYANDKKKKALLFKCKEITADNLVNESISVRELKHYGFTLFDINKKFNIRWVDICQKLKLNASDLKREDGWFDINVLSSCVNTQQGNLIHDLQFSINDIRRLKCADAEMSQLNFDFDRLFEIGFNKQDLKEFPWYPDTMASLLNLQAKHLSKKHLNLDRNDFAFLILNRGHWTYDFFVDTLEMKEKMVDFLFDHAQQCFNSNSVNVKNVQVAQSNLNSRVEYKQKHKKTTVTLADLYTSDNDSSDEEYGQHNKIYFKSTANQFVASTTTMHSNKSSSSSSCRQENDFTKSNNTFQQSEEKFFGEFELKQREMQYKQNFTSNMRPNENKKHPSLGAYSTQQYRSTKSNRGGKKKTKKDNIGDEIQFINSVNDYYYYNYDLEENVDEGGGGGGGCNDDDDDYDEQRPKRKDHIVIL